MSDKKYVPLSFNKKNAQDFANRIYSSDGSVVTYTKLCDGRLVQESEDEKVLHCAIGEAIFAFVKKDVGKYHTETDDQRDATDNAINDLVEAANLENNNNTYREALLRALNSCVELNDEYKSYDERARDVAEVWLGQVVPLLK